MASSLLPVPPDFRNPGVKRDALGLPFELLHRPLHHFVQFGLDLGLHEGQLSHTSEKGLLVLELCEYVLDPLQLWLEHINYVSISMI